MNLINFEIFCFEQRIILKLQIQVDIFESFVGEQERTN